MSSIRPPAEEGALVLSLHEGAARLSVQLVVCPWRDVADLRLVSLETPLPAVPEEEWDNWSDWSSGDEEDLEDTA
jgi:hypothetical protein